MPSADRVTDLHKQIYNNQWLEPLETGYSMPMSKAPLGVVLQREDKNYVAYPPNLNHEVVKAVLRIDVPIAFTMSSGTTAALAERFSRDQTIFEDPSSGITLPIVESIESVASGRARVPRDTFVCYCRKEEFVLVWSDSVSSASQRDLCRISTDHNASSRLKAS